MYNDLNYEPKYIFRVNHAYYKGNKNSLRKVNISGLYKDKVDKRLLNSGFDPYTEEMNNDNLILYFSDKFNYFKDEKDCLLWKLKYNL